MPRTSPRDLRISLHQSWHAAWKVMGMNNAPRSTSLSDRLSTFDYILFAVWAALPFAIFFYVRF